MQPSAVILPGAFFAQPHQHPSQVKRWIVDWTEAVTGEGYGLAGDASFAIDLGHALRELIPEDVSAVQIWPCVKSTPATIYQIAARTQRRMRDEKIGVWFKWANLLETVGYTLPIWPELRELSERMKRRPSPEGA